MSNTPPSTSPLLERLVVGVITTPLALLFGWVFFFVLTNGLSKTRDWMTILVEVLLAEFTGALFFIFAFASAAAITGKEHFGKLVFRRLGWLAVVSLAFVAVAVIVAVIYR